MASAARNALAGATAIQLRSANPLERLNAERAINRLVGAMMLEQNDKWSLQRRYIQLEGLQSLSDHPRANPFIVEQLDERARFNRNSPALNPCPGTERMPPPRC